MEPDSKPFTPVSTLGEFGLIGHLTNSLHLLQPSSVKGVGDDAAVIRYKGNPYTVATTDMLLEGIHFDLTYTPLKHLGYKAAMVNFSDIYAMNARPRQLLISLGISGRFGVEQLEELYAGLHMACTRHGVDLVGGDTNSSLTGLTISITVLGEATKKKLTYRNTAREGDLICVSGDLGAAYLGLQVLEREKKLFEQDASFQPDLSSYEYIIGRFLKPEARKDIIDYLERAGITPHAMIDLSDGLSSDLMHVCEQSQLGCKIFNHKIPIEERTAQTAEEFGLEPLIPALNGGEDYELLFTVGTDAYEKIIHFPEISIIGHMVEPEAGRYLVTQEGTAIELKAQGWNHSAPMRTSLPAQEDGRQKK